MIYQIAFAIQRVDLDGILQQPLKTRGFTLFTPTNGVYEHQLTVYPKGSQGNDALIHALLPFLSDVTLVPFQRAEDLTGDLMSSLQHPLLPYALLAATADSCVYSKQERNGVTRYHPHVLDVGRTRDHVELQRDMADALTRPELLPHIQTEIPHLDRC